MDKDKLTLEKISNYKDIRRNLWTAIVLLTGGIVALSMNMDSFIKIFWFISGTLSDLFFAYSLIKLNESIDSLLSKLGGN